MAIVSEINMLGVTLTRSASKTRAANGEELVKRVQKKLNVYRAGRLSPLTCKPHTANTYLLSKISYRSGVVSLRASDTRKLQSALKQWVSQELLQKPAEVLLYRDKSEGGLELVNVAARANANLIKNFLDLGHPLSSSPSIYMKAVYSAFVLEEEDMQLLVKKPSFLPQLVYDTIREAWEEEGDLIARFTTKTWQERLTSRMFTHSRDPQTGLSLLIQTDQEKQMQEVDWECCWVNARCPGLTPTQQSFLFKMVHGLLPFNERLLKFGLSQNNHCNFCGQKDDSCHFLQCQQASGMGSQIRSFLQEATKEQKEISWLHLRVLFFNLHPTLRLPAMVLTAELGLLATHCRKRSKKLEPPCLISTIRSRGKALGRTRKFQQASQVLLDWAREASSTLHGHNVTSSSYHRLN